MARAAAWLVCHPVLPEHMPLDLFPVARWWTRLTRGARVRSAVLHSDRIPRDGARLRDKGAMQKLISETSARDVGEIDSLVCIHPVAFPAK